MRASCSTIVLGGLAFSFSATAAYAQDSIQNTPVSSDQDSATIIVTAQRRQERLQDVPITITSLASEELDRANVTNLPDIVKLTPAVRFDYQGNFVQPTIRGVGNAVVTTGGGSNVGIYVDGFYSPNPAAGDFRLLNLKGIQVLKGPQGTLFGRNTTGGAILVTTRKPEFDTAGSIKASYGRFDSMDLQGYVTTGLSDSIAVDLAAAWDKSDGYARNIVTGPDHPGRSNNWSMRAGLRVDLSDKVSFLLRYAHQDMDDGTNGAYGILVQDGVNYAPRLIVPNPQDPTGLITAPIPDAFVPTGFRDVAVNPGDRPRFLLKSDVFQLTGEFDLDFADLTSYTQYRREDASSYTDQDQTALDLLFLLVPTLDKTFTQEFLLTSKPGGRLQWTAGAFYFNYVDQFVNSDGPVTGAPNASFDPIYYQIVTHGRTQSLAGYLDVTYEPVDKLFLTAGARYSHDKFDRVYMQFPPGPVVDQPGISKDSITPRAVVRYELDNSSSIYASYSRGYKAPLTDVLSGALVDPEKMDAFELGIKHARAGFSANLSAWYYKYRDLQVSVFENGLSKVLNAANAKIYGIEGEVRYDVTPDFGFNASAAYVHSEYSSFPTGARFDLCSNSLPLDQCLATGGYDSYLLTPFDASGGTMQRAPKFTANFGARYGFDLAGGRATLSGNYYHTSKFYFDLAEQFYEDGYDLVGLRAEWTDADDRLTLAVFGDNLLNSKYYAQVIPHSSGMGTIWGEPATWGLSVSYNFGN